MVEGIAVKWTDEQVERVGVMIRDGKTFSQIADVFKTTRSAIASVCKRKNLREKPVTNVERNARTRAATKKRVRKSVAPTPVATNARTAVPREMLGGAGRAVLNLRAESCRWPIGDPHDANFRFCGEQRDVGVPYCAHHQSISRVPIRR